MSSQKENKVEKERKSYIWKGFGLFLYFKLVITVVILFVTTVRLTQTQ